jgi:hypothetical protein
MTKNRYSWLLWMNGERWVLKRSTHFHTVAAQTCRCAAINYAIRHGLIAETSIPDEDTVIVQMIGDGSDKARNETWWDYSDRKRRESKLRRYREKEKAA